MKISYRWLQEHIEETLPSPEVLAEKITFHAFEVEHVEKKDDDTVFDIDVLPNRAGDCLSHFGIARELTGLFNLTLKEKSIPTLPEIPLSLPVELQSDLCCRYIAIQIDGVKVEPSPDWLKQKIESVGQKSINNIVDAANFIMLDCGQPIHVFNREEIDGGLVVRLAHNGEAIKLIGGEERTLSVDDLVIADYLGTLAIAGVKGGAEAEVTDTTTSIVIEVANFDPVTVRKTSRRLNLITDASKRFENNFSPVSARGAAEHIVSLLIELGGGTIVGIHDEYKKQPVARTISFSVSDITRVLGNTIAGKNIEDIFSSYHYAYNKETKNDQTQFTLTIPYWREDLIGAHDIAEEIGRIVGYDTIPTTPLPFTPTIETNVTDVQMNAVRAWCTSNGFREVQTYTFQKKGEVYVLSGAKDKSALRSDLSTGLKASYELNKLNAPLFGIDEIKLFEIGTVFFSDKEEIHVAMVDKGITQELPLAECISQNNIDVKNFIMDVAANFSDTTFKMWSLYPFVTRDVAVWVDSVENKSRLQKIVEEFASSHCVRPATLFDEFAKDGRTSIAFRFVFQARDRTLTDTEVTEQFSTLLGTLKTENAFEIR